MLADLWVKIPTTVSYFTKEVNPSLAKPQLIFNRGLAKLSLGYLPR